MAEKVGALAYDLVMNTVRFERGMKKTRSSLRTLNQNFKKAAHPVEEYEQRMRDLLVLQAKGELLQINMQLILHTERCRIANGSDPFDETSSFF